MGFCNSFLKKLLLSRGGDSSERVVLQDSCVIMGMMLRVSGGVELTDSPMGESLRSFVVVVVMDGGGLVSVCFCW